MAGYLALYRKYRPKFFREVIGQEHITEILQNALKNGRIAHAYLFAGVRGTGKTTTARILAKALNCERGISSEPCGQCRNCLDIDAGRFPDVIEIDAASYRGINEIREIRDNVKLAPLRGRYKVYIIDEVHMLTQEAFNALLKTLEEPPEHVVFVLATTDPHKVPSTIISRCQRFDFRRISSDKLKRFLRKVAENEKIDITQEALELLVKAARGSVRDALSLLDQLRNLDRQITASDLLKFTVVLQEEFLWRLLEGALEGDISSVFKVLREAYRSNASYYHLISLTIEELRQMIYWRTLGREVEPELTDIQLKKYQSLRDIPLKRVIDFMNLLVPLLNLYRSDNDPFFLESAIFRWISSTSNLEDFKNREGSEERSEEEKTEELKRGLRERPESIKETSRETEKTPEETEEPSDREAKERLEESEKPETKRSLFSDLDELALFIESLLDGRSRRTWNAVLKRGELSFDPEKGKLYYKPLSKDGILYFSKLKGLIQKLSEAREELRGIELEIIESEREGDFQTFVKEVRDLFSRGN